jgi:hypothetical protein
MRLIALLLSFFVLYLTAVPCADVFANGQETHATHSVPSHNDSDQCSPFCTCNCCAMSMVCQVESVDFRVTTIVREHLTTYPTLLVPQRSGEIWQPPKLS